MKHVLSLATLVLVPLAATPAPESAGLARAMSLAERALEQGALEQCRGHLQRALERDPKSIAVWDLRSRWAEAQGDRDELVYALHKQLSLMVAQRADKKGREGLVGRLTEIDPVARDLFGLKASFLDRLTPLAEEYEKDDRPHSAIRIHKEILALDPDNVESRAAIERIASTPDPSLAGDAKPRDLMEGVSEEWIAEFDAAHLEWKDKGSEKRENYVTNTNAGYEVMIRAAEAMEQMNAFYRVFFHYGEDGGGIGRIDLNIFKTRDEYLRLGIGPPVEWSGGHFTGNAVETYIDPQGGFESTVGTLFHEAAHQFVSLATNAAGWLNEGLASFFEGTRILPNGTVVMNLPATHRLFPLATRMERGWMSDHQDGMNRDRPSESQPTKAPTFRIVLENQYEWGPPWYAPTWGVVYFLYNYQDPVDGRFVYRKSFWEFVQSSGGRVGKGAVKNFEETVLANPAPPTKGVPSDVALPRTSEELDGVWRAWTLALRDEYSGRADVDRPYLDWGNYAIKRGDFRDAAEHYEKGILATPDQPEIFVAFADLLVDELGEPDRAAKLYRTAIRLLERTEEPDTERIAYCDKRLGKVDPKHKTLARIHEEFLASARGIVQSYLTEGLNMMAMDVSWRTGSDFGVDEMFEFFEEGARRSRKSLAIWRLAYNEENLDGWASSARETFTPVGEVIQAHFAGEGGEFDYRFLTLDEITSGDFSLECEISGERDRIKFAGIVFGRKSGSDFHAAVFYPPGGEKNGWIDVATFYGGGEFKTWRHDPVPDKRAADRSTSDAWYKLRADVTGRTVDIWLDGEYVTTQVFPAADTVQGGFGLMMGKGDVRFRNVRYLAREARDPGAAIEREIKMEQFGSAGESRGGSWLDLRPPFPVTRRWIQEERTSFEEAGIAPQLLVMWSITQNEKLPIDDWLRWVAERYAPFDLRIVSIASFLDDERLDAYLRDHPFPGSVACDVETTAGFGDTFELYAVNKFQLPRLILLDIDYKVAWEGDPGFKSGLGWDPQVPSYLESPLEELIAKRKLRALKDWRERWLEIGVPALAQGRVLDAIPLLQEAREFDWRVNDEVMDAQRRLQRLESALGSIEDTAAEFDELGCEPALDVLVEWSRLIGAEVDVRSKVLRDALKSDSVKSWKRALSSLKPAIGRVESGKEPAPKEEILARLSDVEGFFPDRLRARLEAAQDADAYAAALTSAPNLPEEWLVQDYFEWK